MHVHTYVMIYIHFVILHINYLIKYTTKLLFEKIHIGHASC